VIKRVARIERQRNPRTKSGPAARTKFNIAIYHNAVTRRVSVRGRKKHLIVTKFLNDLAGRRESSTREAPGNTESDHDWYELDDEQDAAFSTFMRKLAGMGRYVSSAHKIANSWDMIATTLSSNRPPRRTSIRG
jgi:hypothetical protein